MVVGAGPLGEAGTGGGGAALGGLRGGTTGAEASALRGEEAPDSHRVTSEGE